MLAGDYARRSRSLRQAVAGADPGSLTYAYALYDLGRSLRLAGDPRRAIPILERRLQIPNQTDVVRAELDLALQAPARRRRRRRTRRAERRRAPRRTAAARRPTAAPAGAGDEARRRRRRLAAPTERGDAGSRRRRALAPSALLDLQRGQHRLDGVAAGVALGAAVHPLERLLHRVDGEHAEAARHARCRSCTCWIPRAASAQT